MKFIRWQDGWFRETVCVRDSEGCSAGDVRRPELCSQQFCPRPSRCCCGRHFNKMGLERTSLFTVQYFLGGEPKGEECISGSSLVSNAYCHMMTFPEQLSWPFLSQGSPVHVQHLPAHLQILLPGWNPLERDHSQSISSLQRNFLLFELTPCDQNLQVLSV